MSIKKVFTQKLQWLVSQTIVVEWDFSKSLPWIDIIWLPDSSIRESKERIKSVFRKNWIKLHPVKYILNLAPSEIKKRGSRYDLPLAVCLYLLSSNLEEDEFIQNTLFFGEIWLGWDVRYVSWLLPTILSAQKQWRNNFVVPEENIEELKVLWSGNIYCIKKFSELVRHIQGIKKIKKLQHTVLLTYEKKQTITVHWHQFIKKALQAAVIWKHNVLMVWPPWSGKSLLWKYLRDILPPLSVQQCKDVWSIQSILWKKKLNNQRPFISLNQWITKTTLLWWWHNLTPGLLAQSNHWVLFIDELAEYSVSLIDSIRVPMETKEVTVERNNWKVTYPMNNIIVAAMNPCKCWRYMSEDKACVCSEKEIIRYQWKVSWPIFDRFDIILHVKKQKIVFWSKKQKERIVSIKDFRKKQIKRNWWSLNWNTEVINNIEKTLTSWSKKLLKNISKKSGISTRVLHKFVKVWRTIADIRWSNSIEKEDITQAYQWRTMWMFIAK